MPLCTLFLHKQNIFVLLSQLKTLWKEQQTCYKAKKNPHSVSKLSRCYNVGVIQQELLVTYEKITARERNISEIVNKNEPILEPT